MNIGILGNKGHGKNTIADYIVLKYKYTDTSFAKPIKEALKHIAGFSDEQLYGNKKEDIDEYWGISPREFMQFLGTEIMQFEIQKLIPNIGREFWVKRFMREKHTKIVVSDVRFQHEVDTIHQIGGKIIKVIRNIDNNDSHISEKGINDVKGYDYVIYNNGTLDELYHKIDELSGLFISKEEYYSVLCFTDDINDLIMGYVI